MARILVSGWYGFANLGDEAILSAIIHSLREGLPDAEVRAVSFRPQSTEAVHRVEAYPHLPQGVLSWIKGCVDGRVWKGLKGLLWCDVLLIGGGGFLADWQPEAPWVWLRQAIVAHLLGKKVMLYGIGAGPFTRPLGKWLTRTILSRWVDAVTVRDEASRQWLEKTGLNRELIEVTADPAVNFPAVDIERKRDRCRKVGICVAPIFHVERHWPGKFYKYERFLNDLAESVKNLAKEGFEVSFIAMQPSSDVAFAEKVIEKASISAQILKPASEIDSAVKQLAEVDILVALRLHAAILGATQTVPTVGIVYNHKVNEFLKQVGLQEHAQELGDGSVWREADIVPEHLVKSVKSISVDYSNVCAALNKKVLALKKAETRNFERLNELLLS